MALALRAQGFKDVTVQGMTVTLDGKKYVLPQNSILFQYRGLHGGRKAQRPFTFTISQPYRWSAL